MGPPSKGMLLKTMGPRTKGDPFNDNGFPYKGDTFKDNGFPYKADPFKDNGIPYKGDPFKDNGLPYKASLDQGYTQGLKNSKTYGITGILQKLQKKAALLFLEGQIPLLIQEVLD